MLPSFMKQTITRIRPGTRTLRGSDVPDWGSATRLQISGCSVQPAGTSLSQDGRVLGTTDGMTAYIPANADVKAGDRIEYAGEVYTITGAPRVWPSASGGLDHIQLNLERWSG